MFSESELEDMDMRRAMTKVKPWEPVRYGWAKFDSFSWAERGDNYSVLEDADLDPGGLKVTLANSQRVIVRALSEDRKAERRKRREGVWGYSQNLQLARSLHESDDTRRAVL